MLWYITCYLLIPVLWLATTVLLMGIWLILKTFLDVLQDTVKGR
jgi:hypothetical protein